MDVPTGHGWLAWLESTALASAMRDWLWLYPTVEIVHILGFVVLVGAAVMFDLRLLGVSRRLPVVDLERHLLPWARLSLVLVALSGVLLFVTHATELGTSLVFRLKLLLMGAAGLNAAIFHRGAFQTVGAWNQQVQAPATAQVAAVLSLVLWTGVICCGRLLAYF